MNGATSVRLRDGFEHRNLLAGSGRRAEVELHDAPLLRQLDLVDLFERLHPALDLCRLGGMRREPFDEPLLLRQHRLLPHVRRFAVGLANRALPFVEVVVARVRGDVAAIDLRNPGHGPVHELAVVRRHEQGPGQRLQEVFQPDDRLDVQMVRRLVHQQRLGPAEQHTRHGDAHLPAARELADIAIDPVVLEPEPVQHLAGLCLQGVPAKMLVLFLHLAEAREDSIHVVGLGRIAHRVLELLELVMQVAGAAAAENRLVQHRPALHFLHILPEIADRQPLRHRHVAFIRRLFADDHPKEGGLARAVRSDETDSVTGIELKGRVDEKHLSAVLLADLRK